MVVSRRLGLPTFRAAFAEGRHLKGVATGNEHAVGGSVLGSYASDLARLTLNVAIDPSRRGAGGWQLL
jgi:hypothetical protein